MIGPTPDRRSRRRWGFADVSGPSMVPTLHDGDRLIVQYGAAVRPGDLVVARRPDRRDVVIVKRVSGRVAGGWWLLGDNSFAQGDSRVFGPVPDELVLGRVVFVRHGRKWRRPAAAPPDLPPDVSEL